MVINTVYVRVTSSAVAVDPTVTDASYNDPSNSNVYKCIDAGNVSGAFLTRQDIKTILRAERQVWEANAGSRATLLYWDGEKGELCVNMIGWISKNVVVTDASEYCEGIYLHPVVVQGGTQIGLSYGGVMISYKTTAITNNIFNKKPLSVTNHIYGKLTTPPSKYTTYESIYISQEGNKLTATSYNYIKDRQNDFNDFIVENDILYITDYPFCASDPRIFMKTIYLQPTLTELKDNYVGALQNVLVKGTNTIYSNYRIGFSFSCRCCGQYVENRKYNNLLAIDGGFVVSNNERDSRIDFTKEIDSTSYVPNVGGAFSTSGAFFYWIPTLQGETLTHIMNEDKKIYATTIGTKHYPFYFLTAVLSGGYGSIMESMPMPLNSTFVSDNKHYVCVFTITNITQNNAEIKYSWTNKAFPITLTKQNFINEGPAINFVSDVYDSIYLNSNTHYVLKTTDILANFNP